MGKAIVINDLEFSRNLGKVTISGGYPPAVIEVAGINIMGKPSSIQDSAQLSVSYTPTNTSQKGVTWSSSDDTIAVVNSSGYIIVKKTGTVTITATSTFNNQLKDSFVVLCSITQIYTPVASISLTGSDSGKIDETIQLATTILPANATNKNVKWSSSDDTIAVVNSSGLVTLKTEGSVIITATSVSEPSISGLRTITITASSLPSGSALEIYNTYITASGRSSAPQLLNMLNELKDEGFLDKMDELYYLAGETYQQIKFNIVNPAQVLVNPSSNSANFTINPDGVKSSDTSRNYFLVMNTILSLSCSFIAQCGKDYKLNREMGGYKTSKWEVLIKPNIDEGGTILRLVNSNQLIANASNIVDSGATILSLSGSNWYYDNSKGSNEGTFAPGSETATNAPGMLFFNDNQAYTSDPGISAKFACCGNNALTKAESLKLRELFDKYYTLL